MRPVGYSQLSPPQPSDPDPIGSVPPPYSTGDPSAIFNPEQLGNTPYTEQSIDTRYEQYMGIATIPVAGPPGTAPKIVTLHAPYVVKTVKASSERQGEQNRLPHWDTGNQYERLSYKSIMPAAPLLNIDGTRIYRTTVTYSYCIALAPSDSDTFAVGSPAYDLQPADFNILTPESFDPSLIPVGGATY